MGRNVLPATSMRLQILPCESVGLVCLSLHVQKSRTFKVMSMLNVSTCYRLKGEDAKDLWSYVGGFHGQTEVSP